jgi:hypothetical protein
MYLESLPQVIGAPARRHPSDQTARTRPASTSKGTQVLDMSLAAYESAWNRTIAPAASIDEPVEV